ncbi:Tail fiber assembly protein [Chromobacterium violaceum]|uniref:tail fiber assembly protein n=1 Tax=Chromobacterium violaceum TaxID=536 RepID=UPI003CFB0E60
MQQQKTVYSYHPQTGEYLGIALADRSPLDAGEVWLIPAFATEKQPPVAGERKTAVFRDGVWLIADDWRAVPLWRRVDALPVQAGIGDTPSSLDATQLAPPPFAVWKTNAWVVDQNAERAAMMASAQQLLQQKLATAYQARRPLEDAVELGIANTAEQALLTDWKRYCVELVRVTQSPKWPVLNNTDWPTEPK